MFPAISKIIQRLANGFAVVGGLLLILMAVMTVSSIVGRAIFSSPIPGDYELIEVAGAIAIFTFLPYTQLTKGHVIVEFFSRSWPPRLTLFLDMLANIIFTFIATLLCWRAWLGGIGFFDDGDASMILQLPLWWGFIPVVICLMILVLTCLLTIAQSCQSLYRLDQI